MSSEFSIFQLEEAIRISKEIAQKYSHIYHVSDIDSLSRSSSVSRTQGVLNSYFTYLSPTWSTPSRFDFDREFSAEELVEIFKGAVFIEIVYYGQLLGSVSSVDRIYTVIAKEDYATAKEMSKWMFDIGLDNYFSTHLVDNMQQTLLESMFSKDPIEKQQATRHMDNHRDYLQRKASDYGKYCYEIEQRTSAYWSQQGRDIVGRESGAREKFLEELNKLALVEKLEQLANDTKHSPKYYPTNIIHESTVEVLKKLDKELLKTLLKRMYIPLRKSPWISFRNKLYEVTGTEPFHGISKSFW